MSFNLSFNETRINCVHNFPCIYNVSSETYHNKIMKDNAWEKIGEELHITSELYTVTWFLFAKGGKEKITYNM